MTPAQAETGGLGLGPKIGIAVVALFALVFSLRDADTSLRALQGEGQHGTFLVKERDCSGGPRGGCFYGGNFVSDDGDVRLADTSLEAGGDDPDVGDSVAAIYSGDDAKVYSEGSKDFLWLLAVAIACGGYLLYFGFTGVRGLVRRWE